MRNQKINRVVLPLIIATGLLMLLELLLIKPNLTSEVQAYENKTYEEPAKGIWAEIAYADATEEKMSFSDKPMLFSIEPVIITYMGPWEYFSKDDMNRIKEYGFGQKELFYVLKENFSVPVGEYNLVITYQGKNAAKQKMIKYVKNNQQKEALYLTYDWLNTPGENIIEIN